MRKNNGFSLIIVLLFLGVFSLQLPLLFKQLMSFKKINSLEEIKQKAYFSCKSGLAFSQENYDNIPTLNVIENTQYFYSNSNKFSKLPFSDIDTVYLGKSNNIVYSMYINSEYKMILKGTLKLSQNNIEYEYIEQI